MAPPAISGQTIAYQFTASESFDGSSLAKNAEASGDEDQFFEAAQADVGVFPINDPTEQGAATSRGNRWLTWIELRLDAPAPAGGVIEIVDNTSVEGTSVALKAIADLGGKTLVYIESGILIPQGSVVRINGAGRGVFRYHVTFLDPQGLALAASLTIATQQDGSPGLVFSESVAVTAGVHQLVDDVIQRFDASGLLDDEMILRLPASPVKDQEIGIKEVGNSGVAVILDGNGNLVASSTSAPSATQSTGIARQSLTLKFDGSTTWWLV
jgi:hypothetical protein